MILNDVDYYVGLDCGTNSIGFAVTDTDYNLLQAKHKDMWGSHLFDEASTAKDRRLQRNARKRLQRRNERIKLLQSIFSEEISKIDPTFFLRLNESALWQEDRSSNNKQSFSLFNDVDYTDKDYNKEFPTIYHLRKALIDGTAKKDPRLVYLALHHIIKNRGHFLFSGDNLASIMDISQILVALKESYYAIFEEELIIEDPKLVEEALKIKKKRERLDELCNLILSTNDKRKKLTMQILVGYKAKPQVIFENDEYEELPAVEFSKVSFEEEDLPVLEESLTSDEYRLIESLKALYDWALLANIMSGKVYISYAKVEQFNKNKRDLALLKSVIKKYTPDKYNDFFHGEKDSFASYIGYNHTNKKLQEKRIKKIGTEDFYKAVKKLIEPYKDVDDNVKKILSNIENDTFLVLLRSFRNGVLPYQVNKLELEEILRNAKSYLPWLNEKDSDDITPIEKIVAIMKYRIPYYVGSLVDSSRNKNAWLVRKEEGKILPWNFEQKVDTNSSAEKFIKRMTNKCTYLPTEDVVPKQSLLYQKYMVLNEINNIRFNGEDISVEQKQEIYHLFEQGSVTQNKIKKLAVAKCWIRKGEELTIDGIDTTIKSSLPSYLTFKSYIIDNKLKTKDVEEIIRWLTLFSDGGKIAKEKIKTSYGDNLSSSEINKISNMHFSGWGKFSHKFLCGIEAMNPETGELTNIISLLWDTNYNLMELINDKRTGISEQLYSKQPINILSYNIVDEARVSPKVKRQIWQALRIVKEIEHIMGHRPKKIFIEMTRYVGEKGKRTKTRKDQLLEKLKDIHDPEVKEIYDAIEKEDGSLITKRDRLYLYYTQLGKCMYSGEKIDLEDLLSNSRNYDIDHIYPYSKSNDDSLENKVIVKSSLNREKSNIYPLSQNIRSSMTNFWQKLKDLNLISSEKFHRLTRSTELTDDDLQHFINRQIVETSQSTITLARILEQYFGDGTKIIYSKAGNVSDFRNENDLLKSRIINHLHHAKDAYLNIVVGNTLYTKYTSKFFLKEDNNNFNHKFLSNIPGAWIMEKNKSMEIVRKTMTKDTVLFTRQPEMRTGQLFDLTIKAKHSEQGLIPTKGSLANKHEATNKEWTDKYGGYNSLKISHFALIKRKDKNNSVYSFITIPILRAKELLDKNNLLNYCSQELKLEEVEIVRAKVLMNTLISSDGFLMTITGSSNGGKIMVLESAVPLLLDLETTQYVKSLEKFSTQKVKDKTIKVDEKYDKITKGQNEKLYQLLLKKAKLPIYQNRPGSALKILEDGYDKFCSLEIEDQITALISFLNYLGMNNGAADFRLIGGKASNGTLTLGTNVSPNKKKVFIIDQSITGIYDSWFELK